MSKVVIIDYRLGNLFSVHQALKNIGVNAIISDNSLEVLDADAVVLPGVGAFHDAMDNLNGAGLSGVIKEYVSKGKPFLGVCLGLQLLFSASEEFGSGKGLDILPGTVRRFQNHDNKGNAVKVPQIAWNQIYSREMQWQQSPLKGLKNNEHMYFVHSFYVEPDDKNCILSLTKYHNKEYASAVLKDNVFACQFHPEKSGENGLSIYKNWAQMNNLI